ncbi:zinc finger protein 625-like isoform X2 [Sardina pilchardus]
MDLGLPFSSGCAETHQFGLRVMVKEEDIKEEEYDHMITCPDEKEKPCAEFHCKSETDVTESPRFTYSEILQTTVKTEEDEEDDEEEEEEEEVEQHEHLLESETEHPGCMQQKIHGQNDDLNLQPKGGLHQNTVCNRSFTSLSQLENHQQTHSPGVYKWERIGKRRHKCLYCGKELSGGITQLKSHMFIHTGEKPHKCAQCGKAFARVPHLKAHMLIHTGEKPWTCAQCGKAFRRPSALKNHMLTDCGKKPHECAQCGNTYTEVTYLKAHLLMHTEDNPHKCTQCGKTFARPSELKHHMMTHTGEKPHICALCGKAFLRAAGLKRHSRSKHRSEFT